MNIRNALLLGLCLLIPGALVADFQYDEMTQVTGGSIVSMAKFASVFSKQARSITDPVNSTILVKGNRMARISPESTEIVDLDKETITEIYPDKHTYTVVTFQEMKQAMEEAMKKAQQQQTSKEPAPQPTNNTPPPEMKFDVKVTNTGASKDVAGLASKESILKMTMQAKDRQSGQTGNIAIANDMWMAPEIPGYEEVRDFNKRFAVKMGEMMAGTLPSFKSAMPAMQPGMMSGMSDMVKEMSKLQGVPVSQTMRMGTTADGSPLPAASEAPLPKSNGPSAGDVTNQAATTAANTAANDAAYKAESNVGSHMGSFGNVATSLGGFGGFHKKKKDPAQDQQQQKAQSAQAGGAANQNFAVLMESTTQMTKYSSAAVDSARFNVPSGYAKVQADIQKKQQ
jgi:hypothetical protein